MLARQQSDYKVAIDYSSKSLAVYRRLNEPRNIAAALNNLAGNYFYLGDYDAAAHYLEEVVTLERMSGNERGMAVALGNLGAVAFEQGNLMKAKSFHKKRLHFMQAIRDKKYIAGDLIQLGEIETAMGTIARHATCSLKA